MRLLLLLLFLSTLATIQSEPTCDYLFADKKTGTPEECDGLIEAELRARQKVNGLFPNLPHFSGAYCYNDGSGRCKAFAGRFEFYFNSFTDEIIGPAPASEFVDSNGYHERVPRAYNINGDIVYNDRAINWARKFKVTMEGRNLSLLSINDFNWCGYTENDWWPYKSAVKDAKSNGRYHIYFFNRQSCIYDTSTGQRQHYNTRFLHNSSLRIDLDINPTIFAMEDKIANDTRLVKHHRQHWYEVTYYVKEKPKEGIKFFVVMSDTEQLPSRINSSSGPLLSRKAYRKYSDACVSDLYQRERELKNAKLVQSFCGLELVEIADYSYPEFSQHPGNINEVSIHAIPRFPKSTQRFFGVNIRDDEDWSRFANDGYTFSTTTSIPVNGSSTEVDVVMLYASYRGKDRSDEYDEYYPMPYLAKYRATYVEAEPGLGGRESGWRFERDSSQRAVKNLNYVDDIAYLHQCHTILIVFGPLYSELPADRFDLDSKAPIDSIYELGLWEMANAFFAEPGTSRLWVYFRMNHLASVEYACAAPGSGKLVTAKRVGKYSPRHGAGKPDWLSPFDSEPAKFALSEEFHFQELGVFKGSLSPEAPDPANYPLGSGGVEAPAEGRSSLWVWMLVGVAALLMLAMCVVCMLTYKRRRRRQRAAAAGLRSDGSPMTERSGLNSRKSGHSATHRSSALGGASSAATGGSKSRRSAMKGSSGVSSGASRGTTRSQFGGGHSSGASSASSKTRRSRASSAAASSGASSAASSAPGKTRRSGFARLKLSSKTSRAPTVRSAATRRGRP